MANKDMTNEELDRHIINFLNGDESSFDLIYEGSKKSVFLTLRSFRNRFDENMLEDLMQDTYMNAIRYLGTYTIGTNFKAWISRIAKNHAINVKDRRDREDIVDSGEREDLFSENKDEKFFDIATRNLNEIEKDIVMYKIVLDLTFKQIAEILDRPLGTIYGYYREATKKMKEEMKHEDS